MSEGTTPKKSRLLVYSIRDGKTPEDKSYWLAIGTAFVNRDGSLNVLLDALPTNGRLHIREVRLGDAETAA